MRWLPLPLDGGAYRDDTTPWTSQDRVNYLPVTAERSGTRSTTKVQQCPGSSVFTVLQADTPIRGMYNAESLLLVVCGNTLYTISTTGEVTARGTIPGVGRVSMAHNQITGGNEIAIANGLSGYIYNTKLQTLTQITDDGFPGAKVFGFIDGYIMAVFSNGRQWGHSGLANAGDWNVIDRAEAEAQPDRITAGITTHREWLVLGGNSGEFYRNSGADTNTFERVDGTELEIGCPSTWGAAKLDSSVFFVGSDGCGYRLNGYTPQRITTHAIEQAWSRCDLSSCYTFTYEDQGHKIWYVTFTDGQTWGFDVATGEWHRRKSEGLSFWRMACLVQWNGGWFGGDYANGTIYALDWNLSTEGSDQIERSGRLQVLHDNENRLQIHALKLVFDTGKDSSSFPFPKAWLAGVRISGDLPSGVLGDDVIYQYSSSGGVYPHSFSVPTGSVPTGLSMDSSGVVSGTRSGAGTFNFTVRVTDANGDTADLLDQSSTANGLTLTGDIADGVVGTVISDSYVATGGTPSYTYTIQSGTLPPGLSMNSAGTVSGTYTTPGDSSWVVRVTDSTAAHVDLADTASVGGEIFMWRAEGGLAAKNMLCAYIDGDTIAIGQDNNNVSYSTDRGDNWTINPSVHSSFMDCAGIVKFLGDWYTFGQYSGAGRMGVGTLSSFTPRTISFIPGRVGANAYVIGSAMYVAEYRQLSGNLKLRKTLDGTTFSVIDTGIAPSSANESICSHAETSDGWHLFGTTDGKVLRTNNLSTFTTVLTVGAANVSVAALGAVVLVSPQSVGSVYRSTDSGATFATPYSIGGAGKLLANGFHFIFGRGDTVFTSPTGIDLASWTTRLNTVGTASAIYLGGQGYASGDLAVFGTASSYAYVGDVT